MAHPEDLALSHHLDPEERDLEAPVADAAEQARVADPGYEEPTMSKSFDVSEWDAHEQSLVVQLDDDYR